MEESEIIKEKVNIQNAIDGVKVKRTFKKKLTARTCKQANITPLDLIKSDEVKKNLENMPIDLTWDSMINFTNAMIEFGDYLTEDSDVIEIIESFTEAMKAGFL